MFWTELKSNLLNPFNSEFFNFVQFLNKELILITPVESKNEKLTDSRLVNPENIFAMELPYIVT